ncbi:MAG: hypothetical protein U0324_35050 [Polyangiales bacterium]
MTRGNRQHDVTADHVAFTVEALAALPGDADLAKLSGRVAGLLSDWGGIDAEGRRLEREVIRASAHVKVADATLDAALAAFAADLLAHVGNDTSHATYTSFFTEPHEEVIAMGLDSEVPEVTLIVHALDQQGESAPSKLRAHLEPLRAGLKLGNGALASRSDALADLGRHMARVEAWHETAAASLRSTHGALARLAQKRALPAAWADAFFNVL